MSRLGSAFAGSPPPYGTTNGFAPTFQANNGRSISPSRSTQYSGLSMAPTMLGGSSAPFIGQAQNAYPQTLSVPYMQNEGYIVQGSSPPPNLHHAQLQLPMIQTMQASQWSGDIQGQWLTNNSTYQIYSPPIVHVEQMQSIPFEWVPAPPSPAKKPAKSPNPPRERAAPPPPPPQRERQRAAPPREQERAPPPPPPPPEPMIKEVVKIVEVDKTDYAQIERLKAEVLRLDRELLAERAKPREQTIVEKLVPVEKEVSIPVEKIVEKVVPVEKIVEKTVHVPVEIERVVQVPIERLIEVPYERLVEVPIEKVVFVGKPEPERAAPPAASVGVGLSLQRSTRDPGATVVDRIIPGFAAERSGQFAVGDVVHTIDGVAIQGHGLETIKSLTIGPAGTPVTIDFSRGGQRFSETLVRRLPDYTDGSNADATHILVGANQARRSPPAMRASYDGLQRSQGFQR